MSSFWKIQHKETGLFYQPVRGYKKNSLSKRGKVYNSKPSLKHLSHGYHRLIKGESVFIRTEKSITSPAYKTVTWVEDVFDIVEYKITSPHTAKE